MKMEERDIMSWLLEADPMSSDPFKEHMWLLFYHLALSPIIVQNLRKELQPLMKEDGSFDNKELQNAEYLNGVINETLRLHPPVPGGVSRLTPKEGVQIGEVRVPGETVVSVPLWTVGRCEFFFHIFASYHCYLLPYCEVKNVGYGWLC